jgi:folate-binding Fe-S cluster repair protein YgfZ
VPHSESTDRPSAGVLILDDRIVVRVTGDDRASFLHGMCTADVNGAKSGAILPALFLTEHAHMIADAFIWVTVDALLLDIDAEAWTRTRAHLEKLLVADDVEFGDSTELALIDVEGSAALDANGAAALAPWTFIEDANSLVGNLPRYGGPAATVIAPRSSVDSTIAAILAKAPGARRIDSSVLETIRIENGVACVGVDTTDKTIALEARLNRAISMFGLKFNTADVPAAGSVLSLDGKEVGRVTSAVLSQRFGAIGLAILHYSAWTPGTELKVGEGGIAIVSELPFSQS